MTFAKLRTRFLLSLVLGAVVFLGLAIYADLPSLAEAFRTFNWALMPLILGCTVINYGIRYLKWEYYLRVLDIRGVRPWDSSMIFLGGLSMAMTPGKIGEWLKSYLLKEVHGTPLARSAPMIVAERLSDGVAMLLLALLGVLVFSIAQELVIIGAVIVGVALVAVQVRPLAELGFNLGERVGFLRRRMHHFRELYESSYALFRPRVMLPSILMGLVGWGFECVAMYLVFVGLGIEPSLTLLLQSTFILAAATLAGSLLLLPGGLGATEATIVGFTQALVTPDRGIASAAALLIRLATLWFGVLVGVVCLLVYLRAMPKATLEQVIEDLVEPVPDPSPVSSR